MNPMEGSVRRISIRSNGSHVERKKNGYKKWHPSEWSASDYEVSEYLIHGIKWGPINIQTLHIFYVLIGIRITTGKMETRKGSSNFISYSVTRI